MQHSLPVICFWWFTTNCTKNDEVAPTLKNQNILKMDEKAKPTP
jgi:hypothetical protein